MSSQAPRVVVTGMGAITDVGNSATELWDALKNGRSGVAGITAFEQDDRWDARIAGEVVQPGEDEGVAPEPATVDSYGTETSADSAV